MNIRNLALASILAASLHANAQKDELKTLKKIYAIEQMSNKDIAEYKTALSKAEPLATEAGDKVYLNFYKGMLPLLETMTKENVANPAQAQAAAMAALSAEKIEFLAQSLNATLEYEKTNKKVYTDDIKETIQSFSPELLNYAVALQQQGKHKEGAKVLYALYTLDKKNADYLYYAANFAVNGQDYDAAMNYYNELKSINYSGEKTVYFAKSKAHGDQEIPYNSKEERDSQVKVGLASAPREEKEPSKKPEIYANMTRILMQQKKTAEAKKAVAEGLAAVPNDPTLKQLESELALGAENYEEYKKVANLNDADAVYNLGVLAYKEKKFADAEKHFESAIQLNPKYTNAYINLAAVKLEADPALVQQMNKLGTSAAENKKYDQLKAQRIALFKSTLPYLEKARELDPENQDVITNLLSVYNYLEMTDKYKALKALQQK